MSTNAAHAKPGQVTAMISSTALDLPEHRAAVHRACLDCGVFPIGMEALPAQDVSALAVSLGMVDQADLYLGIYAWRYGWVPDGKDISVTEMEFDRAIERKATDKLREILIFTVHEEHPCTFADVEADKDAQRKLAAFKSKASTGRIRKEFQSVEELRRLVSEALHEFLLRQSKPIVHVATPTAIPSNLPGGYIGRLFLGREDFLADLRTALTQKHHAAAITQAGPIAAAVAGLGGIGKTHAAVEYAHRHRGDYCALLFVTGDSPEKLRASLAALCGVLHLDAAGPLPPDEPSRVTAAVDWLASHPGWLLIVDNVDTPEAATALTGLLERLTTGHVLITSRLHGWADHVETLDLEVLQPPAATDLLLRLTDKHRRPDGDDPAQARRLAELMDGLPLALHQAAGYINEQRLTLAGYLATYQQEAADLLGWFNALRIPYAGPEELGPRPVLITWKTSFDKLDAETRRWLLVFAHFAPEPIPESLLASAPDAEDAVKARHHSAKKALAQAETYSLLTRERAQPRFKLHRLVQQIIRLTAPEADRAAALALGIQLIQASNPGNPLDVRTWPRWNPLQAHAVTLVAHAPDAPAPERLSWLLGELALLLKTKSLHLQAEPYFRRALQLDEASYGPDHPHVAIRLNNLAQLLKATNRLGEAEPLMRRALGIDEASYGPDHPDVASDLNNLAQLLQDTNRLGEAEPLMRRALGIFVRSLGPEHPNSETVRGNYAGLLQALKLPETEIEARVQAAMAAKSSAA